MSDKQKKPSGKVSTTPFCVDMAGVCHVHGRQAVVRYTTSYTHSIFFYVLKQTFSFFFLFLLNISRLFLYFFFISGHTLCYPP